jgi:hypothetical protein
MKATKPFSQKVTFLKRVSLECVRCGAIYNVDRVLYDTGIKFLCGAIRARPSPGTCDGELVRRKDREPKHVG